MRDLVYAAFLMISAAVGMLSAAGLGWVLVSIVLQRLSRLGDDRGLEKEAHRFGTVPKFTGFDQRLYLKGQSRQLARAHQVLALHRLHVGVSLRRLTATTEKAS